MCQKFSIICLMGDVPKVFLSGHKDRSLSGGEGLIR